MNEKFISLLIKNASDYVGLVEVIQNATWDDPDTKQRDIILSNKLAKLLDIISGWNPGDPYCAAYVGGIVYETLNTLGYDGKKFQRFWTAHCMTNFRKFRELGLIRKEPKKGSIVLWQNQNSDSGHTGFVVGSNRHSISTIEGNTHSQSWGDQRNGDGLFMKTRSKVRDGNLIVKGYIWPEDILKLCELKSNITVTKEFIKISEFFGENDFSIKRFIDGSFVVNGKLVKSAYYNSDEESTFAKMLELKSLFQ